MRGRASEHGVTNGSRRDPIFARNGNILVNLFWSLFMCAIVIFVSLCSYTVLLCWCCFKSKSYGRQWMVNVVPWIFYCVSVCGWWMVMTTHRTLPLNDNLTDFDLCKFVTLMYMYYTPCVHALVYMYVSTVRSHSHLDSLAAFFYAQRFSTCFVTQWFCILF